MNRQRIVSFASVATACLTAMVTTGLRAASIYGTAAPFSGSRSVQASTLSTNDMSWDDAELAWEITSNGNGTLNYKYTITGLKKPAGSHFTLDISDDAVADDDMAADPNAVTDPSLTGDGGSKVPKLEFGNKDGITGAVKFDAGDEGTLIYMFTSNRNPVFGDFFIKGGPTSKLMNTGFGDQTLSDPLAYIARPNGVIPEPATFAMVGMAGAITVLAGRRRRTVQLP